MVKIFSGTLKPSETPLSFNRPWSLNPPPFSSLVEIFSFPEARQAGWNHQTFPEKIWN